MQWPAPTKEPVEAHAIGAVVEEAGAVTRMIAKPQEGEVEDAARRKKRL